MFKKGQGRGYEWIIDVRVNGEPVTTFVFGAKSGHPYAFTGDGDDAVQRMEVGNALLAATLAVLGLLHEDNHDATMEFFDHLAQEKLEREEAFKKRGLNDGLEFGDIPF